MEENLRYEAALQSVKKWNAKMMMERKLRQPYLDNTTGLAQTNCHLWVSEQQRHPGKRSLATVDSCNVSSEKLF